jgi:hypothetical protein
MKDTQQNLLIEDLDYCNTVCDETEEIVGGKSFWDRKFWRAVRGEALDTWNGGGNGEDLFIPFELRVLERLIWPK